MPEALLIMQVGMVVAVAVEQVNSERHPEAGVVLEERVEMVHRIA
jgi:hypothetical protein